MTFFVITSVETSTPNFPKARRDARNAGLEYGDHLVDMLQEFRTTGRITTNDPEEWTEICQVDGITRAIIFHGEGWAGDMMSYALAEIFDSWHTAPNLVTDCGVTIDAGMQRLS